VKPQSFDPDTTCWQHWKICCIWCSIAQKYISSCDHSHA